MRFRAALAVLLAIGATQPAAAFSLHGCDQQRHQYLANWNDTSRERTLFTCSSHYGANFRIKIGKPDGHGHTMMSLVLLARPGTSEAKHGILRVWLDREQADRLRAGRYPATVLRQKNSCWIRGDLDRGAVFFLDNARPAADNKERAGAFYNKAPRFSVYNGNAYDCRPGE